jgi:hypothetical protein
LLVFAKPVAVSAESAPTGSFEVGLDVASRYLFRGLVELGDHAVVVPSVVFDHAGWTVSYSGYVGEVPNTASRYREHDFAADYSRTFGALSLTAGAVTYRFNRAAERDLEFSDTYEVYAIASWDRLLRPTLSYYRDVDAVNGGYAQLALSRGFRWADRVGLELSAALGFDFGYNLDRDTARKSSLRRSNGDPNDVLLGAAVGFEATESLTFRLLVQRSLALETLDKLGEDNVSVFTAGASYRF